MVRGHVVVVGAGVFGVASAVALRARGYEVTILDPGPLPHPLAESTDISKIVRLDYGAEDALTGLMEQALERFRQYSARRASPLFHETGVLFLCQKPMAPGGFEHESYATLTRRGHPLERLDKEAIRRRFPAWEGDYVDGYFNPQGGYVESGNFVMALLQDAMDAGVKVLPSEKVTRLEHAHGRVKGVVTASGLAIAADHVVVATGAWVTDLLPHLEGSLRSVGQPVFHLRPADPDLFRRERFPVFGADISRTGYYGFPLTSAGIVKIANHGVGREMHPESLRREVIAEEERALRQFLAETFPKLADAPIAATRICVYGDSLDGDFWITREPEIEGLVIAAGGSGHGFKFGTVLGDMVADAVEGRDNPWLKRFCYRPKVDTRHYTDTARHLA